MCWWSLTDYEFLQSSEYIWPLHLTQGWRRVDAQKCWRKDWVIEYYSKELRIYVPRSEMPFMTNFFKKVTNLLELETLFQTLLWLNNIKKSGHKC